MDVTINIPIQGSAGLVSVEELKRVLTEYALKWIGQTKAKEEIREDEFELPKKFEKLCGCISEEKVKSQEKEDPKLEYLINKHCS